MLVVDLPTNLCKIVPPVPKRMSSALDILIQVGIVDFRIVFKARASIADMFVAEIFFINVI
jgi:hypothetical protein